mgnify:FL=1
MAEHDAGVTEAERPGGANIREILTTQEFGAHYTNQGHPAEGNQDAQQPVDVGLDDACQDDQDEQYRQARPDLDEALPDQVDFATEVALRCAIEHADDRACQVIRSGKMGELSGTSPVTSLTPARATSLIPVRVP